jgi:hypothetical protein
MRNNMKIFAFRHKTGDNLSATIIATDERDARKKLDEVVISAVDWDLQMMLPLPGQPGENWKGD